MGCTGSGSVLHDPPPVGQDQGCIQLQSICAQPNVALARAVRYDMEVSSNHVFPDEMFLSLRIKVARPVTGREWPLLGEHNGCTYCGIIHDLACFV